MVGLLGAVNRAETERVKAEEREQGGNQPIVRGDRDGDARSRPTLSFLFPFLFFS